MTSRLGKIRNWDQNKRNKRLRELGMSIRKVIDDSGGTFEAFCVPQIHPLLDEAIMCLLETMRTALPRDSPLETLEPVLELYGKDEGRCTFHVVLLRFRDTRELVRKFRDGTPAGKSRVRPLLVSRGLL